MDRDPFDFNASPPPASDDVERPEGGEDDIDRLAAALEAAREMFAR